MEKEENKEEEKEEEVLQKLSPAGMQDPAALHCMAQPFQTFQCTLFYCTSNHSTVLHCTAHTELHHTVH